MQSQAYMLTYMYRAWHTGFASCTRAAGPVATMGPYRQAAAATMAARPCDASSAAPWPEWLRLSSSG